MSVEDEARALRDHLLREIEQQTAHLPELERRVVTVAAVTGVAAVAIRQANIKVEAFAEQVRPLLAHNEDRPS